MYQTILQIAHDIIILGWALLIIALLVWAVLWVGISYRMHKVSVSLQKVIKDVSVLVSMPASLAQNFLQRLLEAKE